MYATLEETPALAAARELAEAPSPAAGTAGAAGLDVLDGQVCAEAGIWAPAVARRALAQSRGDIARAVALVRVWAAALPEVRSLPVEEGDVHLVRRLSAAYPEVPGGQWLGAAPELASRLLRWDDGPASDEPAGATPPAGDPADAAMLPTRRAVPRVRDLIADVPVLATDEDGDGLDPAGAALAPPFDRATRLAILARGESGSLVSLAALTLAHRREAILAEMTSALVSVRIPHPRTGRPARVVEVPVVEAEAVVDADVDGAPGFAIGWGASLGTIERRAIALALLDGSLQADGDASPSVLDEAGVMAAVDGSATNGFVDHLRLPHYASFASYVDQARRRARPEDPLTPPPTEDPR